MECHPACAFGPGLPAVQGQQNGQGLLDWGLVKSAPRMLTKNKRPSNRIDVSRSVRQAVVFPGTFLPAMLQMPAFRFESRGQVD
jgi:hypothetical protein